MAEHPLQQGVPRARYLLVTHIPFSRTAGGGVVIDSLWALDLRGLAASSDWDVQVCAPEMRSIENHGWGPGRTTISPVENITFIGFPAIEKHLDAWRWLRIRQVLRQQVERADFVHTSNYFPPYLGLSYAHRYAVATGKKTVFVIAEDFYDMLDWEWVRLAGSRREAERRRAKLLRLDSVVRANALTASITFLHTPAAVERYRCSTRRGIAIRQPGHECEDVVAEAKLEARCRRLSDGGPLHLTAVCRHKPLKGLDMLIEAICLLRIWHIDVVATLYGEGEQTGELRDTAEALGLGDCLRFPGPLPAGPPVYQAIAACDVFLMPHRTTDFGRAFFDAMAAGVPVIAFRTKASEGTLRDGVDGLLCPVDDVEALASTIARFHQDRALLADCARNARARALLNTQSAWYRLRAAWTRSLEKDGAAHGRRA